MTHEQRQQYLNAIKRYTAAITVSRETANAALVREGIYMADGRLAEAYGGKPKAVRGPRKA